MALLSRFFDFCGIALVTSHPCPVLLLTAQGLPGS